jgi:TPR repeat protein
MTRNLYKFTSHLLPLVAFLFIANVGTCAEVEAWTKETFTKAEQGYASAQFSLGLMYSNGQGVPQDDKEALKWWRKAAEQGHGKAQFNLGVAYANDKGVAQDYKEAFKWYRKAAEQGLADAQRDLGVAYGTGRGVAQDTVNAYAWCNVGSANGSDKASKNRDLIAKEMTPEQIAKAQELSKVWFEKFQPKK